MKNSSEFTKTHKIARNWNYIKYKSIQISTNAFLNSFDVEVGEMVWITVISHSLLYMESHIRGQHSHAPAQASHHSHAVPVAGQEGVQVEIM